MYPEKTIRIFLLSFILVLGASSVWAESWKEGKDPRDKTRERIHMIKMWKMTEALKLDREGAVRFFAVNNQYEETKRRLWRDFHEDTQRLRNLMRDMNPPERELRDLLARIKGRKKEINDLSNRQMEDEMNLMRPEQQARYILFQIDFRREMEDLIREVREEKPPKPGYESFPEKIR